MKVVAKIAAILIPVMLVVGLVRYFFGGEQTMVPDFSTFSGVMSSFPDIVSDIKEEIYSLTKIIAESPFDIIGILAKLWNMVVIAISTPIQYIMWFFRLLMV